MESCKWLGVKSSALGQATPQRVGKVEGLFVLFCLAPGFQGNLRQTLTEYKLSLQQLRKANPGGQEESGFQS